VRLSSQYSFVTVLLCSLSLFFFLIVEMLEVPKNYSSLFSCFAFMGWIAFVLRQHAFWLAVLFPFLFPQLSLIISVTALDAGAFAPEIKYKTNVGNSASLLFASQMIFVLTVSIFYCFLGRIFHIQSALPNTLSRKTYSNRLVILFAAVISLVLMLTAYGVVYGFPVFQGEQRFFYWNRVPLGYFMSKVLFLSAHIGLFAGYLIARFPQHQRLVVILSIALTVLSILYSNKFSWIAQFFTAFVVGFGVGLVLDGRHEKFLGQFLGLFIKFIVVIVVLVVIGYSVLHGYFGSEVTDIIIKRIFLMQGQIWWFTLEEVTEYPFTLHIGDVFQKYGDLPSGIFLLMQEHMPPAVFNFYFENKIPLSMGFPAMLFHGFGLYFGFVAVSLFACLYSYVLFYCVFTCTQLGVVRIGVAMLLFSVLPWGMSLGSTYVLFNSVFLLGLAISVIDLVMFRVRSYVVVHRIVGPTQPRFV
jgi:hypothetical protein